MSSLSPEGLGLILKHYQLVRVGALVLTVITGCAASILIQARDRKLDSTSQCITRNIHAEFRRLGKSLLLE